MPNKHRFKERRSLPNGCFDRARGLERRHRRFSKSYVDSAELPGDVHHRVELGNALIWRHHLQVALSVVKGFVGLKRRR